MEFREEVYFDGETYDADKDRVRLTGLLGKVTQLMADGEWRTLHRITAAIGASSEASVSARLRDLRKPRFGGHTVERRRVIDGLWEYRVVLNGTMKDFNGLILSGNDDQVDAQQSLFG